MYDYLFTNALITSFCILSIMLLKHSPARLRLYICLFAILAWLVPWHLVQINSIQHAQLDNLFSIPTFDYIVESKAPELQNDVQQLARYTTTYSSINLVWAVLAISAFLVVIDSFRYVANLKRWRQQSVPVKDIWGYLGIEEHAIEVRFLRNGASDMATGIIKPTIWLSEHLRDKSQQRTALLHELTHIKQNDLQLLWLINIVQKIMWFNPLIGWLAKHARQLIELSCDQRCELLLPEGEYQRQLIRIILDIRHPPSTTINALSVKSNRSFNLKRISSLNKEYTMKKQHFFIVATLSLAIAWVGVSNATNHISVMSPDLRQVNERFNALLEADNPRQAYEEILAVSRSMSNFSNSDKAKVWEYLALMCITVECGYDKSISYLERVVQQKEAIEQQQVIKALEIAHKIALQNKKYYDATNFYSIMQELGLPVKDTTEFLQAVVYMQTKQYRDAIAILQPLIHKIESNGDIPQESWLKVLLGSFVANSQLPEAVAVSAKLADYYQTEQNQQNLLFYRDIQDMGGTFYSAVN